MIVKVRCKNCKQEFQLTISSVAGIKLGYCPYCREMKTMEIIEVIEEQDKKNPA